MDDRISSDAGQARQAQSGPGLNELIFRTFGRQKGTFSFDKTFSTGAPASAGAFYVKSCIGEYIQNRCPRITGFYDAMGQYRYGTRCHFQLFLPFIGGGVFPTIGPE
jgi:hypothetical protein